MGDGLEDSEETFHTDVHTVMYRYESVYSVVCIWGTCDFVS